jgi:hypothetical protein
MTMEHRGRASEGRSTKNRSIPARDFPSPTPNPSPSPRLRPAFNPKSSPILPNPSQSCCTSSNRFWSTNRSYRKQMIKPRLTGSRFADKLFEIRQVSTQNLAPESLRKTPRFSDSCAFLPGSAKKVENDVTYSKQRTGEFLPGATTARHSCSKPSTQEPTRRGGLARVNLRKR